MGWCSTSSTCWGLAGCLDLFPCGDGNYHLTVHVDGTGVYVADSDCPGQDCVHTGAISRAGQSIVCLPAQVVISLVGAASDVDAVLG